MSQSPRVGGFSPNWWWKYTQSFQATVVPWESNDQKILRATQNFESDQETWERDQKNDSDPKTWERGQKKMIAAKKIEIYMIKLWYYMLSAW